MVLKHFNFPCSPPPSRGSGEERIWGKWTCLEMVLWSNSCLCCLEIGSSVHRSAAAAAQSTCKDFMEMPAVQSAGGTNRNNRRNSPLCLTQGREDQQRLETHKHCTASYISKPSSASCNVHWVLFILSKHHMSSTCLASATAWCLHLQSQHLEADSEG